MTHEAFDRLLVFCRSIRPLSEWSYLPWQEKALYCTEAELLYPEINLTLGFASGLSDEQSHAKMEPQEWELWWATNRASVHFRRDPTFAGDSWYAMKRGAAESFR